MYIIALRATYIGSRPSRRDARKATRDSYLRVFTVRVSGGFCAWEEFVDVLAILLGTIEDEHELGGAAELQAFAELVADEPGRGGETFDGRGLLGCGAHHANVDFGLLQVRGHAHLGDGGERDHAWVLQLAGEHGADFLADFSGN